ncbi:hypothetical protein ACEQ38_20420 [Ralstonia syzygii subsp. celebesensis]|uniref:hypothetical protein n=1 Tax=Ralstonia syzygii TaxID=28097 RepID=UPI00099451A1
MGPCIGCLISVPTRNGIPINACGNALGCEGAVLPAANTTRSPRWTSVATESAMRGLGHSAANDTLVALDVSCNLIGKPGALALANNIGLTTLNVSLNRIGAAGMRALEANATLAVLKG